MQNPQIASKSAISQHKNKLIILKEKIQNINKEIVSISKSFADIKCLTCGKITKHNRTAINFYLRSGVDMCRECNPLTVTYRSKGEQEVVDFLMEIGVQRVEMNKKYILGGQELDIYLPDYKIGIEYNGLYWHSELFKDIKFHQEKKNIWELKMTLILLIYGKMIGSIKTKL